jgi:hypothetical protein
VQEAAQAALTPAGPPASPEYASGDQDLPEPDRAVPPYHRSAWTMLIETSRRWRHVAKVYLYPLPKELLNQRPELIGEIGSAALTRLPDDTPLDVLEALERHSPSTGRSTLMLASLRSPTASLGSGLSLPTPRTKGRSCISPLPNAGSMQAFTTGD